jgi:CRISPR-associated protein (Cas_Csd1)
MIQPLVDLARQLPVGTLPPPGYYHFGVPVRLEIELRPDGTLHLTDHGKEGPENGRTSGTNARLIADVYKAVCPQASELHASYQEVLRLALASGTLAHPEVVWAVKQLQAALQDGSLKQLLLAAKAGEKDWISFTARIDGRLEHLINHPEVQQAWLQLLSGALASTTEAGVPRMGDCAACGTHGPLIRRTAVKVPANPASLAPITSLNQSAFLSQETDFQRAPIALCLDCGDSATRALNWLLTTAPHHQYLHVATRKGQGDRGVSLTVRAVAWMREAAVLDELQEPLGWVTGPPDTDFLPTLELPPSEADLDRLWRVPLRSGQPDEIDTAALDFHLLTLSPTKGHVIFRSLDTLTLGRLHENLSAYQQRTAQPVLFEEGARLASHRDMIEAALRHRSTGGRITRDDPQAGLVRAALLKHAYLGSSPPQGLLLPALHAFQACIREPDTVRFPRSRFALHALACALTLYRSTMDETSATLSGRLLAVIERAQLDSQRTRYAQTSTYTVATRTISAAAARPSHVLGQLLALATKAYLPKAPYHRTRLMELNQALMDRSGIPARLSPHQQAEFSLGYYSELHQLSQRRPPSISASTPDHISPEETA